MLWFCTLWACIQNKEPSGSVDSTATDTATPSVFLLDFPLLERDLFSQNVGVDHDRVEQEGTLGGLECMDYLGRSFPHCYDQHDGNDFILQGGFSTMDNGSAHIIAAAAGVVVLARDGHYDRCHGTLASGVDCDGHPKIANAVTIEHDNGYRTLYWHMMKDTVAVAEGDYVEMGTILGKVGSSGNSSMPHLHFELQDENQNMINPFSGPYSQEQSYWCQQDDPIPDFCE